MKDKLLIFIMLVVGTLTSIAQTQQGYVKTIGRQGKKGVALSGVTVRAKGNHNAVVSKSNGQFTMKMKGLKNGDAYSLQQVQKNGYELNDAGTIGRQYAFSATVPLTIVMVSTAQLQADIQRIENNAYAVAEKNYKAKMAKLEKQLNENTITAEEYRTALQDLQNSFEKYQSLIESLAEHYAHTDYDMLDENEAEINTLIENGELEKADSLIHTLFDPIDVLKHNKEALDRLDQTIADAQGMIDQANTDMAAVLKQQEKDAEYLYQLYTIALTQFDNERAAKYIQTRAALDTTNLEWLYDAGKFIEKYIANYSLAFFYFTHALELSISQFGEMSLQAANCYSSLGANMGYMGDLDSAMNYLQKSYSIYELSDNNEGVAAVLNNIATIECLRADYQSAEEYFTKSISLIDTILTDKEIVITAYNGKGMSLAYQNKFRDAIEWMKRSLTIGINSLGNNHPLVAMAYNNIGGMYMQIYDLDKAQNCFEKALSIQKRILGENHPSTAYSFLNIAGIYLEKEDYATAMRLFLIVRDIRERILGKYHSDVAECYNAMGYTCNLEENYEEAISYYSEAIDIWSHLENIQQQNIARALNNLGCVYSNMKMHSVALDYFKKSLYTHLEISSTETPSVASCYNNIAGEYDSMGEYDAAIDYYNRALSIREKLFGQNDDLVSAYKCNLGYVYEELKNYDQALNYYSNALTISKAIWGDEHKDVIMINDRILRVKYLQALFNHRIQDFLNAYCFVIKSDKFSQMQDNVILLELDNWTDDSQESVYDTKSKLIGMPFHAIVIMNGEIAKYYFQNNDQIQIKIHPITKEERQQINQLYNQWKKENRD